MVMNLLVLLRFSFVRVLTHTGHHVAAVLEAQIHWLHTITIRQTDIVIIGNGFLRRLYVITLAFLMRLAIFAHFFPRMRVKKAPPSDTRQFFNGCAPVLLGQKQPANE